VVDVWLDELNRGCEKRINETGWSRKRGEIIKRTGGILLVTELSPDRF